MLPAGRLVDRLAGIGWGALIPAATAAPLPGTAAVRIAARPDAAGTGALLTLGLSRRGPALVVSGSRGAVAQGLDRNDVQLPDELPGDRFELLHQGPAVIKLTQRRPVFEVRSHGSGHRGEGRDHPAELVGYRAQSGRVPVPKCVSNRREMHRAVGPGTCWKSARAFRDRPRKWPAARAGRAGPAPHARRLGGNPGPGRSPPRDRRAGRASRGIRPCRPRGTVRGLLRASAPSRR